MLPGSLLFLTPLALSFVINSEMQVENFLDCNYIHLLFLSIVMEILVKCDKITAPIKYLLFFIVLFKYSTIVRNGQ